jgi:hypothetical protein
MHLEPPRLACLPAHCNETRERHLDVQYLCFQKQWLNTLLLQLVATIGHNVLKELPLLKQEFFDLF